MRTAIQRLAWEVAGYSRQSDEAIARDMNVPVSEASDIRDGWIENALAAAERQGMSEDEIDLAVNLSEDASIADPDSDESPRSYGPGYFAEWDGVAHEDSPSLGDTHELAEWMRLGPSGY